MTSEYQLWTSKVLGEILGASRQLKPETLKEVFWRNMRFCAEAACRLRVVLSTS